MRIKFGFVACAGALMSLQITCITAAVRLDKVATDENDDSAALVQLSSQYHLGGHYPYHIVIPYN